MIKVISAMFIAAYLFTCNNEVEKTGSAAPSGESGKTQRQ